MSSAADAAFDSQTHRNRSLRWRRYLRTFGCCLSGLGAAALVCWYALDYLANTPRERAKRGHSYWARVRYGVVLNYELVRAALTAPADDPQNSALPLFEIYLAQDRIAALSAHLPQSGKVYQSGLFKVRRPGQRDLFFEANLRLRGDSLNHWAFPQKSWRVRLKHQKRFRGMRQFNLYLPRSKSKIPDFLGYELAQQMGGLVVPTAFPVHFRLNRNFDGLRVFLEQIDEDFLTTRNIPWDRIFIGDIDFVDIYGSSPRHALFLNSMSWEVLPNPNGAGSGPASRRELDQLIALLPLAGTDPVRFTTELPKVLDIDAMLRYMAYLEIVNSVHVDESHNQRFYVDAQEQLLRPIVWDPVAYYWGSSQRIDLTPNRLFQALLQIPTYRAQKNRYIWEAIQGPLATTKIDALVRAAAQNIASEIMASPQFIYTFSRDLAVLPTDKWEAEVAALRQVVQDRNAVLQTALAKISATVRLANKNGRVVVVVQVGGDANLVFEELCFEPPPAHAMVPKFVDVTDNNGLKRTLPFGTEQPLCLSIGDELSSIRRAAEQRNLIRESGTYQYEMTNSNTPLNPSTANVRNAITGERKMLPVEES